MIAQHAAQQNERAKEQGIGFDDPLQGGDIGVESLLDRRQRDIDRGCVDDGEARAGDGRRHHAYIGKAIWSCCRRRWIRDDSAEPRKALPE